MNTAGGLKAKCTLDTFSSMGLGMTDSTAVRNTSRRSLRIFSSSADSASMTPGPTSLLGDVDMAAAP